jgi:hypothetical protein
MPMRNWRGQPQRVATEELRTGAGGSADGGGAWLQLHPTAMRVAEAEVAGGAELLGQGSQVGLCWLVGRGVGAELGCEEA